MTDQYGMRKIFSNITGLFYLILTYGYDKEKKVHYTCCMLADAMCYIEISDDETNLLFCTDDLATLEYVKAQIERRSRIWERKYDVFTDTQYLTECYMYSHFLECVAQ